MSASIGRYRVSPIIDSGRSISIIGTVMGVKMRKPLSLLIFVPMHDQSPILSDVPE